jgi:hypothetical protein
MDQMIEAALAATRQRIASPAWADDLTPPGFIGPELDGLAEDSTLTPWSPNRQATMAALRVIRPVQKLAVLCMARDEAPYLAEWIAHYRAIGADRIFIYSNDNSDGTDALLRWFAANAPVTPIFTTAAQGVNIQRKNYEHALFLLPELRLYEWVALVDADEFLVPAGAYSHHLPTMLDAAPQETDAIVFPWRWRLWDRAFARQPGTLSARYPHATAHNSFKPVMRMEKVTSLRDFHAPRLAPGGIIRDSTFAPVPPEKLWAPNSPKNDSGGWIDHYWAKSFEEFLIKKRRGDALASQDKAFQRAYELFFTWTSAATPENFLPAPESLTSAIAAIMAGFAAKPSYQTLQSQLQARYAAYADEINADSAIRQLYNDYLQAHPLPVLS